MHFANAALSSAGQFLPVNPDTMRRASSSVRTELLVFVVIFIFFLSILKSVMFFI
jgi:hypothetical protein